MLVFKFQTFCVFILPLNIMSYLYFGFMFCLNAVGLLFLIVLSILFAKYTIIYLGILYIIGMRVAFSCGMQLFLADYKIKNIMFKNSPLLIYDMI